MATKVVFLTATGAGIWTVPSDFGSITSVECIGAGGGGTNSPALTTGNGGGGGGAYSAIYNLSLTPGSQISYSVGAAGPNGAPGTDGGNTWFNGTSFLTSSVGAKGGGGASGNTGGSGGSSASSIGTLLYSGGNGGNGFAGTNIGGGGGGSAGPNGNGKDGGSVLSAGGGGGGGGGSNGGSSAAGNNSSSINGGAGGAGNSGTGGGTGGTSNGVATSGTNGGGGGGGGASSGLSATGAGGQQVIWTSTLGATAGPGGGGGGRASLTGTYIANAGYGGGAGGITFNNTYSAQGIIVITYTTALNATSLRSSGNLYSVGGDEVFLTPGSIQFNGSNQYLSFPSSGLTLSGANWTMEAYIYLTTYSAGFSGIYSSCIFGAVNTSNQGFSLYLTGTISSYTSINAYGQVNISASYNFSLNTWYHVAVTHTAAGVWLIYINGIALSTTNTTAAGWSIITPYTIGYARPSYQYYFPGYISNFRLTIGTLLYTSNFTPPAAPLLSGANTSVLLNTSYGTTASFLDSSNNNLTITRVSSPTSSNVNPFTINTVQRILNSGLMQLSGVLDEVFMVPGSLQFNGVNQYLTIANSSTTIIGSNNFTLECWAYQASKASTYPLIFGNYNSSFVANTWGIFFNRTDAPNGFVLNAFNGSLFLNTGSTNVSNGWNHIAFVRNANTINCFVNGIQSSNTATYTSSIDGGIQSSIYVADAGGNDSPTFFNGNITNLRLTIGSSLYNSNFTLPIAPLLPDANTELLLNTPYNIGNTATFSDSSVNNLTVTQSNNVVSVASSPFNIYTASRLLSTGTLQLGGYFDEVTSF